VGDPKIDERAAFAARSFVRVSVFQSDGTPNQAEQENQNCADAPGTQTANRHERMGQSVGRVPAMPRARRRRCDARDLVSRVRLHEYGIDRLWLMSQPGGGAVQRSETFARF